VLVHDYLNQQGGAERVVLELCNIFQEAPLYTSIYRPNSTWPQFRSLDIRTTWLQHFPVDQRFRTLFPLYPSAFRSFGTLDAAVVVSSSSGWAHMVQTSSRAFHVVYCYTPARWLYSSEYLRAPVRERLLGPGLKVMRRWDRRAAHRADLYIAISHYVARRIHAAYGIDAPVVYPPVDVDRFTPRPRGSRLLVVSRLLPYKRVDVVVEAATRAGIGLDVVGAGPSLDGLRDIAGPTVSFHGAAADDVVTDLMEQCRALCLPGVEDFGITPVEAQSAGKPVVAFAGGGALETVHEGVTGSFYRNHDSDAVLAAIARCDALEVDPDLMRSRAARFSHARFAERLLDTIDAARS
jgi:glycosyltransferase involved in cell wall biosynthesis